MIYVMNFNVHLTFIQLRYIISGFYWKLYLSSNNHNITPKYIINGLRPTNMPLYTIVQHKGGGVDEKICTLWYLENKNST